MRRWVFVLAAVVAAGVIVAGSAAVVSPVTVPSAAAASQKGCMGEPVQKKPGIAGPYRVGRSIHFGYAEWNFPPSCRDEMRTNFVKIYRVKKGKDPKVYSTTSETTWHKKMPRGTYRVKVQYGYRYFNQSTKKYGKWHTITKTTTVRIR